MQIFRTCGCVCWILLCTPVCVWNRSVSSLARWILCWWSTWSTPPCTPSTRPTTTSPCATLRGTARLQPDPAQSLWWDPPSHTQSDYYSLKCMLLQYGISCCTFSYRWNLRFMTESSIFLYLSALPLSSRVLLQPTIADLLSIGWWASSAAWCVSTFCFCVLPLCVHCVCWRRSASVLQGRSLFGSGFLHVVRSRGQCGTFTAVQLHNDVVHHCQYDCPATE